MYFNSTAIVVAEILRGGLRPSGGRIVTIEWLGMLVRRWSQSMRHSSFLIYWDSVRKPSMPMERRCTLLDWMEISVEDRSNSTRSRCLSLSWNGPWGMILFFPGRHQLWCRSFLLQMSSASIMLDAITARNQHRSHFERYQMTGASEMCGFVWVHGV